MIDCTEMTVPISNFHEGPFDTKESYETSVASIRQFEDVIFDVHVSIDAKTSTQISPSIEERKEGLFLGSWISLPYSILCPTL